MGLLCGRPKGPGRQQNSGQFVRCARCLFQLHRKDCADTSGTAQSVPPLHPSGRYTPVDSLTATKRRPRLWITKRCLGMWNAKT
jgi:hypothetical protein